MDFNKHSSKKKAVPVLPPRIPTPMPPPNNNNPIRRNRQFLRHMNSELPCKERNLFQYDHKQEKEGREKIDKTSKERFIRDHTDSTNDPLNKNLRVVTRSGRVIKSPKKLEF
ncbi:hypothetical protein FQA39_LY01984 [Lamprigera yunnana]|nr:hypothetical protein FQA39_LY01984 [Lamprigera yunnana]